MVQIFSPTDYFLFADRYTLYSESQYLRGFTSGHGVLEAVSYLKNEAMAKKIIVGIAENSGNPESAINVYLNKHESTMRVAYLDASRNPEVNTYDCITTEFPTYFVSRDEQLAGLEKFFTKLKTIRNPYGTNRIGIYRLKSPCTGKTLTLQIAEI